MIDISLISAETPLLDEKTAETMRGVFQKLEKAVVLKAVVDLKEELQDFLQSFPWSFIVRRNPVFFRLRPENRGQR